MVLLPLVACGRAAAARPYPRNSRRGRHGGRTARGRHHRGRCRGPRVDAARSLDAGRHAPGLGDRPQPRGDAGLDRRARRRAVPARQDDHGAAAVGRASSTRERAGSPRRHRRSSGRCTPSACPAPPGERAGRRRRDRMGRALLGRRGLRVLGRCGRRRDAARRRARGRSRHGRRCASSSRSGTPAGERARARSRQRSPSPRRPHAGRSSRSSAWRDTKGRSATSAHPRCSARSMRSSSVSGMSPSGSGRPGSWTTCR